MTRTSAPGGARTTYTYDTAGRPVSVTDPGGGRSTYTYTAKGELASETTAAGRTTTYGYDTLGRLTSTTDPAGGVTTLTYDTYDHVRTRTDPRGNAAGGVAEVVATVVPGPIGAIAAGVSSVSYAATGNWEKAAEMAVTVAAAAVGVAAAVKVAAVAVKAVKATKKANAIFKDSRVGVRLYNAPIVGKKSLLFGDKHAPENAKKRAGLLNRGKEANWSIGWSARTNYKGVDAIRKAHPAQSASKKKQKARAVFRIRVGAKKVDLGNGPWR
ncbi:RHS repeat protein [Streptomyces sp. NRRL S-495]|uniref:RHS repeat protein n=1 Tax=Streptomyces sp. NRRL S-495 TaxID=1609133 RepID=UPI0005F914B5|nr:RHS repeat protein [Streptomyces sp. NRRL S-495]KJY29641.1 hypothetical protein VR45_29445 [Streptomyces sp. NRRL S-495]